MDTRSRLQATQFIWGFFAVTMFFLFVSTVFTSGGLSAGHVILGIFIAIAAFVSTGMVWNWGDTHSSESSEAAEKIKRSRIDTILSRLSDDELMALRDRLADSMEDETAYRLGDDGELVKRR